MRTSLWKKNKKKEKNGDEGSEKKCQGTHKKTEKKLELLRSSWVFDNQRSTCEAEVKSLQFEIEINNPELENCSIRDNRSLPL